MSTSSLVFHDHDIQSELDPKNGDRLTRREECPFHGSRILGSTKKGDIVKLHPELQGHLPWIFEHYRRIGLACTDEIAYNGFKPRRSFAVDGYIFNEKLHELRPDQRRFETVRKYNSKNYFIAACHELGLTTPPTACFASKKYFSETDIPYPAYFKISESISGNGVVKCWCEEDLKRCLDLIDESIPFQIQGDIGEDAVFLNLQYWTNGHDLVRYLVTEQELEGPCHIGNAYPSKWDPWKATDRVARAMVGAGIKGYFAFDLGVVMRRETPHFYLIECNPRYNGSTYATRIVEKLGVFKQKNSWISKSVKTGKQSFDFELGSLAFDVRKKEGVVVYNFGIHSGSVGILAIAQTWERRKEIETAFEKLL